MWISSHGQNKEPMRTLQSPRLGDPDHPFNALCQHLHTEYYSVCTDVLAVCTEYSVCTKYFVLRRDCCITRRTYGLQMCVIAQFKN